MGGVAPIESAGFDDDSDEHDDQGSGRDPCGVLTNEPGAQPSGACADGKGRGDKRQECRTVPGR